MGQLSSEAHVSSSTGDWCQKDPTSVHISVGKFQNSIQTLGARSAPEFFGDLGAYDAISALLNNVPRPKMPKISVLITYPLPFSKSRKSDVNNVPPPTRP